MNIKELSIAAAEDAIDAILSAPGVVLSDGIDWDSFQTELAAFIANKLGGYIDD